MLWRADTMMLATFVTLFVLVVVWMAVAYAASICASVSAAVVAYGLLTAKLPSAGGVCTTVKLLAAWIAPVPLSSANRIGTA